MKGLTPLVGRQQEVGLLVERWAQAKEGLGQVVLLSGEAGIKEMKEMIFANAIPAPKAAGSIERREIMDRYIEHVLSFVDEQSLKPFKVVLDAGSGVAGLVAPRLFDRLPCQTTRLCFEVDGTFPNH